MSSIQFANAEAHVGGATAYTVARRIAGAVYPRSFCGSVEITTVPGTGPKILSFTTTTYRIPDVKVFAKKKIKKPLRVMYVYTYIYIHTHTKKYIIILSGCVYTVRPYSYIVRAQDAPVSI